MPVTINGDGTITGLSVGGLGSGVVNTASIASNAVTSPKLASGVGGKILQVVEGSTTSEATSSSTSLIDSNLTASITPTAASSKILVLVNQAYCPFRDSGSGVNGRLTLVRDSTTILDQTTSQDNSLGFTINNYNQFLRLGMRVPLFKLDSPNTTNSVTYKTQFCTIVTSNTGRVQCQRDGLVSTIELLEIAA